MRFIDKITRNRSRTGGNITASYLSSCWNPEVSRFVGVDYDGSFRSSGTYARMVDFLCSEVQDHLCCYCMRRLSRTKDVTLEHIIPHKAKDDEFPKYFQFGYDGLDDLHIEPLATFIIDRHSPNSDIPHPHTVAYHNFAASCDGAFLPDLPGGKCCNLARGNSFIDPLFLSHNASQRIAYTEDGMAIPTNDSDILAQNFINAIKLNTPRLKEIRFLWHRLTKFTREEIRGITTENERQEMLARILFKDNSELNKDISILKNYKNSSYWQTLMSYDWFYDYYSMKKGREAGR